MSNKTSLTYQMLCEMNGENYNPSDNRTYNGAPLAMSPVEDIRLHLAMPKDENTRGSSAENSLLGSFFGCSYVETQTKAENSVFHFPKASSISGFIKIESRKITTLMPSSLIERYKIKGQVTFYQIANIYYSTKSHEFIVLMDERLCKDMTPTEILPNEKNPNIKLFNDKKDNSVVYLGITGKTIIDLIDNLSLRDKNSPFYLLKESYQRHFLSLEDGERVIVIRYKTLGNSEISKTHSQSSVPNFSDYDLVADLMTKQSMDFEFFQAAKIRNLFYLMDESGTINTKSIVYFDEKETDPEYIKANDKTSMYGEKGGLSFVIMPYSDDNWNFIKNLNARLSQLCKDLEGFFLSSKTPVGELDKPFSEMKALGQTKFLLIDKK